LVRYAEHASCFKTFPSKNKFILDGGSLRLDAQNPQTQANPPLIPAPL